MKNAQTILLLLTLFSGSVLSAQAEYVTKTDSAGNEITGVIKKRCTGKIDTLFWSGFGWYTSLQISKTEWIIRSSDEYRTLEGVDCVLWEKYTNWETNGVQPDIKFPDEHDWVYAKYRDVNPASVPFSSSVYLTYDTIPSECYNSVCAPDRHQKEARICRYCKAHQTREKSWGYKEKTVTSEYAELLKGVKGS